MLQYKLLGKSGLKVSELCLGTMGFGTEKGLGATKEESFIASMNRKQRAQCHNQVFALTQTTLEKIKL